MNPIKHQARGSDPTSRTEEARSHFGLERRTAAYRATQNDSNSNGYEEEGYRYVRQHANQSCARTSRMLEGLAQHACRHIGGGEDVQRLLRNHRGGVETIVFTLRLCPIYNRPTSYISPGPQRISVDS